MILKVVKYGNPVLRKKGARVESITPEVKELIEDMFETMYAYKGVGLAAQQIGQAVQITVIDVRGVTDRPSSLEIKGKQYHIKLIFKQKYDEPIVVNADREKIRQVLVNLIDNSFKYGKEEGSTSVSLFVLHDQVLVEVTDDGIGIEEKFLPRLFERFFRTDSSRSRQIGGSGLGLAIVKHIIEAHQQTINVRSTEGLGSTFGFTLARAKQTIPFPNLPVLKS